MADDGVGHRPPASLLRDQLAATLAERPEGLLGQRIELGDKEI